MILNREEIVKALLSGDIGHSECPVPLSTQTGQKNFDPEEQEAFTDWCHKFIGPASMDILLGPEFLIENTKSGRKMDDTTDRFFVEPSGEKSDPKSQYRNVSPLEADKGRAPFCIGPLRRALGRSSAIIQLSNTLCAQVMPRLSADLWGLVTTPSFVDPGAKGHLHITVENKTQRLFPIQTDIPYCQLVFYKIEKTEGYTGYYREEEAEPWTAERLLPQVLTSQS